MEITPEIFAGMEPCAEGIEWLKICKNKTPAGLLEAAGEDAEKLEYLNWGMARLLSRENKIRYAVFAAREILYIFEEKYPNDKRPRLAIEAAEKYLQFPTKAAGGAAGGAAMAAAMAAWSAAMAAEAAVKSAAMAAAMAASAASAGTAEAASWASAEAARGEIKILKYGIELLEKQKGGAK